MSVFLILGMIFLLVLVAGGAAIGFQVAHAVKHKDAAWKLASAMGWQPLRVPPPGRALWFGGTAQGRNMAIVAVAKSVGPWADMGSPRVHLVLRVVMEVTLPQPLGVRASALQSVAGTAFEHLFQVEGAGRLGTGAREALMRFAQAETPSAIYGHATGPRPKLRHLELADRAVAPAALVSPAVLPAAKSLLIHDSPNSYCSVEEFGKLLYELAVLSYALEQEQAGNRATGNEQFPEKMI